MADRDRPVYLFHGLMGTSGVHFRRQMEAWTSLGRRVIPLDLPGHGSHPGRAQHPFFEDAVSWVIDTVATSGPGDLVGLSLGASVAMKLALRHPELCHSVVLTGYAPAIPASMEGVMQKQHAWFMQIEQNQPEAAQEFMALHGPRWPETLREVLDDMTFHYPTVEDHELKRLRVPTLVLNGARQSHERHAVCHMADQNDIIQAGLIPGAGHTANLDNPDVFNALVEAFWQAL